jgi:hypothetical protein
MNVCSIFPTGTVAAQAEHRCLGFLDGNFSLAERFQRPIYVEN